MEFDRRAVLHAAHRVAPDVSMSDLRAIVTEVEPLIAGNTRRRLMALVAIAVRDPDPAGEDHHPAPRCDSPPRMVRALSRRELEIVTGLADGLSRDQVAALENVSPHTVKAHQSRILTALGAHNSTHAVALCLHAGLID